MNKITGIRSVDFKITALGYGVVNWNGPTPLSQADGSELKNHTLPKLRGFSNLSNRTKDKGDGNVYTYKKQAVEINFKETPLYISQNCVRHHLFRDHNHDVHYVKKGDIVQLLASITGLIRGYVIPSGDQCKRTSPLLLEDFIDILGNGNYEQMSSSSSMEEIQNQDGTVEYKRGENSIFSKTTFGETEYHAFGSISIEQLQFIALDKRFDRPAMVINEGEGEGIAKTIEEFIKTLDPSRNPKATFHKNYVRRGTIFKEGERGVLLDNEAIDILIKETLRMISELSIRQAKGYMYVDDVQVDYNDSHKMMRIKRPEVGSTSPLPQSDYAVYFEGV